MLLFQLPKQAYVANSRTSGGAKLYFFESGTTTEAAVYTDSALSVAHTQPVTAASSGVFAPIYLDPGITYKVQLKTSSGSLIYEVDPIGNLTAAEVGAVLYARTTAEVSAGVTPSDYSYAPGDVRRYGADSTGAGSSSSAFDAAFTVGGEVVIPPGTYLLSTEVDSAVGNLTINAHGATVNCNLADAGTYQSAIKLTGTSSSRIEVAGLVLAYTGAASGSTLYGLNIPTKVASVQFDSVKVSGFRYYGCEVNATQQTHTNCRYVDNIHAGLSALGGTISLVGCEASNNGNGSDNTTGYGVVLSGTDAHVVGGRYEDNDRYNIDGRRANNLSVDGAYLGNSGFVNLYAVNEDAEKDCANIKVTDSTIDGESRVGATYGIWVGAFGASGTATPGEICLTGNTVKNTTDTGIFVSSGAGSYPPEIVHITGNVLTGCGGTAGIEVSGTSAIRDVFVSDNVLRSSGEILISTTTGGTAAIVTDNIVSWTGTIDRSIYAKATTVIVTGNVCTGTITSGTGLEYSATNLVVDGNHLGGTLKGSKTFDPTSLSDGAGETTTVTVTGAALGDYAWASFSLDTSGITITAWVSAANTVSVRFQNETGGPLDIGSGTLRAFVRKIA